MLVVNVLLTGSWEPLAWRNQQKWAQSNHNLRGSYQPLKHKGPLLKWDYKIFRPYDIEEAHQVLLVQVEDKEYEYEV
jgi:hypothetical protein